MWRCSRARVVAAVATCRCYRPTINTPDAELEDASEDMSHHTHNSPKPRFRAAMDAEVENLINDAKRAAGTLVEEGSPSGGSNTTKGPLAMSRDRVRESDREMDSTARWEASNAAGWVEDVQILDGEGRPVTGAGDHTTLGTFKDLDGLVEALPKSMRGPLIQHCKYHGILNTTKVQTSTIPCILQGRDVCVVAPTGTGKTIAFALPMLAKVVEQVARGLNAGSHLEALTRDRIMKGEVCRLCELAISGNPICPMTGRPHPRAKTEEELDEAAQEEDGITHMRDIKSVSEPFAVVFAPTGVLVSQLYAVIKSLAPDDVKVASLWKTSSDEESKLMLKRFKGCHVLITTPEQAAYAIYKKKVSMIRVKTFVVDELDSTLDVHHFEALRIAFSQAPKQIGVRPQRVFVGSSLPPAILQAVGSGLMHVNRRLVLCNFNTRAETPSTKNTNISHTVLMLSRMEKIDKVLWLYDTGRLSPDQRCMVFCNSSQTVKTVTEQLRKSLGVHKVNVMMLHGKLSQEGQRAAIKALQSGASTCLVCTDIGSLGLDIAKVANVVNFDMPSVFGQWVSRVGRCGRRGMQGFSYSFFVPENMRLAKPVVGFLRSLGQVVPPRLMDYAKKSFVEAFAESDLLRKGKRRSPTREENFTDVLPRERFQQFKANVSGNARRPAS